MKAAGWSCWALFILSASAVLAQSAQTSSTQNAAPAKESPKPPDFSAAGIHGTTAPSGYSTGISREETSASNEGLHSLSRELLAGYVADWPVQSCGAEPGLAAAVRASPQAFAANHSLGLFYLEHGEFLRAIPYLEAALPLRPEDQGNLHALILALLGGKKNQQASALLQSALTTSGHDAALLRLLALAQQTVGDQQEACETYQRAVAAAPDDPQNVLAAGFGLIAAGAPQQATELLRSATDRYPENARLWLGLGIGQDVLRQKTDAVHSLLHAIEFNRELPPVYLFLAALADVSAEDAPAIRARLAEFVVAHPSSAEAHYDYALALWLQHRASLADLSPGEMESPLRLAVTADPHMAKAHYLSGLLAIDAGDLPRAEKEFSETVRLDPANAEAHYYLARAYQRAHNTRMAAEETRQFQALQGSRTPEGISTVPDPIGATTNPLVQLTIAAPCRNP